MTKVLLNETEARRRVDTLRALYPIADKLGFDRQQSAALSEKVARLPEFFNARWMEVEHWPQLRVEGVEHLRDASAGGRGVIVVPAHFGGYMWTSLALLYAGMSVSLLVDARNEAFFKSDTAQRLIPMYVERGTFDEQGYEGFETIDSENPMSLWRLTQALSRGRCAVMFIDGNSGIDGRLQAKGSVRVPFLGREIWARPGIAVLAKNANAGVVVVQTDFDADRDEVVFRFSPIADYEAEESRKVGRDRMMKQLFGWLEAQIRARPQEWEEWWLLPRWWTEPPQLQPNRLVPHRKDTRLSSLVARQLQVGCESLWRIQFPGGEAVVDLRDNRPLTDEPGLMNLFMAAERGDRVVDWVREQDDARDAKILIQRGIEMGLVGYI